VPPSGLFKQVKSISITRREQILIIALQGLLVFGEGIFITDLTCNFA
jgi:hypothetical protein